MPEDNVLHLSPTDLDSVVFTSDGITQFFPRIGTLPQDMQDVATSIFELGGVTKWGLIRHLVEKKRWRRKNAIRTVEKCYNIASENQLARR